MPEEVVEFAGNSSLIDELVSRETFRGVIVYKNGYRNNQGQGGSSDHIAVEISSGITNEEAVEALKEIHKTLSQFVSKADQEC